MGNQGPEGSTARFILAMGLGALCYPRGSQSPQFRTHPGGKGRGDWLSLPQLAWML